MQRPTGPYGQRGPPSANKQRGTALPDKNIPPPPPPPQHVPSPPDVPQTDSKGPSQRGPPSATQRGTALPDKNIPPPPPPPQHVPPPPDVPQTDSKGPRPMSFILTKDLQLERKKLKRPEEILKEVEVEREDIYDKYNKYDFIPMVDSREYLRTLKAEIVAINFSSVEQLTDAFLYSLHHCKISLPSLKWISLSGCYNITDEGIHHVCTAFEKMTSIQVMGCRKLTEKSVRILSSIPTMERIHVEGTNVGAVPAGWTMKMEDDSYRNRKLEKKCVFVNGCPVISPLQAPTEMCQTVNCKKVVIVTTEELPWSPLAVLTNQKDTSPVKKLTVHQDWKPYKDSKCIYNLFQIPRETGFTDLVLSPGCLVVLPYFLHPNNEVGCLDKLILELTHSITSILTKYDDCTFHLLGMNNDNEEMDYSAKVKELYEGVQAKMQQRTERAKISITLSMNTNWRIAALNFYEQQVIGFCQKLSTAAAKCYKKSAKKLNILSSHVKVGKNVTSEDLKFLENMADVNAELFPLQTQTFPKSLTEYSARLAKSGSCKLQQLDQFCNTNIAIDLKGELFYLKMAKLMSYSAQWGHVLFYPQLEEKPVITDFNFLSSFTSKLLESSAPQSCDIRCLGDKVPCWKRDDIKAASSGLPESELDLLISLLEKNGCLMKFPADVWSGLQDVSYVYVLFKDFPEHPHSPLSNYIPNKPINIWEKEKYYFCSPGLPQSFFPNLLRHAFKLGWPVVTWKQGAVIQKGFLIILIELIYDTQGLPVIVVQVRCERSNDTHMTTFQTYCCIVDHLILKFEITAAKTVPCIKCTSKLDRYEMLSDKNTQRFFLEHLVRCGEQRDVRCKACSSASIANVQLGSVVPIIDLVPNHDLCGKALPTSNRFTQCLMCHNCATDGPECSLNLREGNTNWQCECKRTGMLCDHCGMCQRCFLYLKEIVSTICPKFEPLKGSKYHKDEVEALDQVTMTEKGSFLGFIEADTEIILHSNKLTPNFCPDMIITAIHHGHFHLKLEMIHDKEVIEYDGKTGSLTKGDKQVLKEDASRRCANGETLHVQLKYAKDNYTQMRLNLLLNGVQFFSTDLEAQQVLVSLKNRDLTGTFLQVETPGKFRNESLPDQGKTTVNCGSAVASFISSIEMKMWDMLGDIESLCFGGAGLSLSGAAALTLPKELTTANLKYPTMQSVKDCKLNFMCLTWNPYSGNKTDMKKQLRKNEKCSQLTTDYPSWKLSNLIHVTDSPGVTLDEAMDFFNDVGDFKIILMWHFIYASYPEVLLPATTSNLFPERVHTKATERKVKAGFHANVKLGFWYHFSRFGLTEMRKFFPSFDKKRIRHQITTKTSFVFSISGLQQVANRHLDKTGLNKIKSAFNSSVDLFLCDGHKNCLHSKVNLTEVKADRFGTCGIFLSFLDFGSNSLEVIPDEIFTDLPNLADLKLHNNYLSELPVSVRHCKKLVTLSVSDNDLLDLPEELVQLENLTELHVSANRFARLPKVITKLMKLQTLALCNLMLTELPEDIGDLTRLNYLLLHGNCLSSLPKSFNKLTDIRDLHLNGVQWVKVKKSNVLSFGGFQFFLEGVRLDRFLDNNTQGRSEIFHQFDENGNGVLEMDELGKLNAAMFNRFPRFGYKGSKAPDESQPSGFPMEILKFTELTVLLLSYQGFTKVPPEIGQLKCLLDLALSHNPNLISIPAEISTIKNLRKLDLEDCPLLKTPPKEIREKGLKPILAYLTRLMGGAVPSKRTKIMLVGLGGAGKTSLVKALLSKDGKAQLKEGEGITDGIDITTWQLGEGNDAITYNVWDFAGQTVYYNTHQFFLSTNRAIYFLLWNVRLGHEHAGLDFWLSSISVQAPKAPVFVIGSHIDQVNKSTLPIEEIQQRYPQITGFHFVSSYTGQGIKELKSKLMDITLQQQYMGEKIPAVWFTFENNIQKVREKQDIVGYIQIEHIATQSGIFETSEIFQAVQFLHDLGSLQYFSNEYLKTKVVINPQWIVDVMACVVSVKTDVIDEGRLPHSEVSKIWEKYNKSLHSWLLRLTEEFDLTFPLADQAVNIVPCLLPEKRPKITWPDIERGSDIKETRMTYKFEYLPAGLFNRGQVRLYNLSDDSLMWKKGSFLKKNVHIALLQQVRDNELLVTVQGPRPDNILFLIHEVFEGLIAESFNGITYDFSLPCPQCQNMTVKDSHMFDASTIRRALDMKAPFLQCTKYFHTISCSDLLTLLPPDSHTDFDAHLVQCVQGLKDLRKDLCADIFISTSQRDAAHDVNSYIVPNRVYKDLLTKGYKCWYPDPGLSKSTDDMAKALTEAPVFMAFVSNNYANDDECVNIFKYAKITLKKAILAVAVGDGFEWKQSKLGIFLSDEVFVNMTKPKFDYYDIKFDELVKTLAGKTKRVIDVNPTPSCFISYSWMNSAQAVALGTKEIGGALGYGDPRELKTSLEEHGIQCWMDVERVGKNGLFTDIAEGLINSKVVVVCVSDEYANSSTCRIEFRYAANTLKKPLVMAVVGTGDVWRASEVGLLTVMYPIVNFQEKTKNSMKKLVKLVQTHIDSTEDPETSKIVKDTTNEQHKNLSYQELLELAQRKLIRQLSIFAETQELKVYPRLFLVDFMEENVEEEKGEKDTNVTENPEVLKRRVLSRISSSIPPAFRVQKFCVYTLCEHDEGWHSVCEPLELPSHFGMELLDTYVSYLSRITAIMKYNKKLPLKCLNHEDGENYLKWLEESTEESQSDYQTVYHSFREFVMNTDKYNKMGSLTRCHLPTGKTIWLCEKHRVTMRVTCLSNDDQTGHHATDENTQMSNSMVTALRNMDYTLFEKPFISKGYGPKKRLVDGKRRRSKVTKSVDKKKQGGKAVGEAIPESEGECAEMGKDAPDTSTAVKQTRPDATRATDLTPKTAKAAGDPLIPSTQIKGMGTEVARHRERKRQSEDTTSIASSSSQVSVNQQSSRPRQPDPLRRKGKGGGPNQTSRACTLS